VGRRGSRDGQDETVEEESQTKEKEKTEEFDYPETVRCSEEDRESAVKRGRR
jgi:hypothetical protein